MSSKAWSIVAWFAVGAVSLAATIYVYGRSDVDPLAAGLLAFILFAFGFVGSWWFGRQSAKQSAHDVIEPHAKKSIRRIANLAGGVQDFGITVESHRRLIHEVAETNDGEFPIRYADEMLAVLDAQIGGVLRTAADAAEDWRDIVPEIVQRLEQGEPPESGAEERG